MACLLAIQKIRDLAYQRLRKIVGRAELQGHCATRPYRSNSQVSQIFKPLLDGRLLGLIQFNRIATY
jgi:hypothetical protein